MCIYLGVIGETVCPHACPTACPFDGNGMKKCPGEIGEDGCQMPETCIPAFVDGNFKSKCSNT